MGRAAAATRSPNRVTSAGGSAAGSQPCRRARPARCSSASGARDRRRGGRADAGADAARDRVDRTARTSRPRSPSRCASRPSRTPAPSLGVGPRRRRRVRPRARTLRPGPVKNSAAATRRVPRTRGEDDPGADREQHRVRVARGRRRAEVAPDRRPVADLRRTRPSATRRRARAARHASSSTIVAYGHARPIRTLSGADLKPRQLGETGHVEQRRGSPGAEVQLDHHVRAAGDHLRVRPLGAQAEGVGQVGRAEEVHHQLRGSAAVPARRTVPSMRP